MEVHEVKYPAQKHGVMQKTMKEAIQKVGASRAKVEAQLEKSN